MNIINIRYYEEIERRKKQIMYYRRKKTVLSYIAYGAMIFKLLQKGKVDWKRSAAIIAVMVLKMGIDYYYDNKIDICNDNLTNYISSNIVSVDAECDMSLYEINGTPTLVDYYCEPYCTLYGEVVTYPERQYYIPYNVVRTYLY